MSRSCTIAERIAHQNDKFRKLLSPSGLEGQLVVTRGFMALPWEVQFEITEEIQSYDSFTEDNDPYGWHDFGSITCKGHKIFWKIDLYDVNYEMGSPEPENPEVTRRVLTIMLAEEY